MSGESKHVKGLIMDMDGVLWQGEQMLVDLPATISFLKSKKLPFVFATNNSSKTVDQYLEKFKKLGVSLAAWQIINSAQATAEYLKSKHPSGGFVYVVGEDGLVQSLQVNNFIFENHQKPIAVVVGIDRQVTYDKLRNATLFVRSGIPFIGTNPDNSLPTPEGQIPGAGSILAAIEAASGIAPTIIGKPSITMFELALNRLGTKPEETLMIGDRLETDIAGAQKAGMKTALVLTGVSSLQQGRQWIPEPDFIAQGLMQVLSRL